MKKLFLLLFGALVYCTASAGVLVEGEPALVYYTPKTMIHLDFTYTVTTLEQGQFAEFAEELLDVQDLVLENSTTYEIQDLKIGTKTVTDYNRPHKVVAEDGFPLLLTVNEKGLLTGYNVATSEGKFGQNSRSDSKQRASQNQSIIFPVAPFNEEVLEASTPKDQAAAIAKQILHIRETRSYILTGEVEHAPADGRAMKLVLEELDKQEKALTDLFVGKKTVRREHKSIVIEPNNMGEMLFFSEENGFTDADNIEADTIEVRMICEPQFKHIAEETNLKKKAQELSQIVYNIPGQCAVEVLFKGQKLAGRTIPVAQLGVDVTLPKSMFTGKDLPIITFSERTGNIISISK